MFFYLFFVCCYFCWEPRGTAGKPIWYIQAEIKTHSLIDTVQAFNSCTSRPGAWQCLVAQTPMADMSKRYAKRIHDPCSLQINVRSVMSSSMPRQLAVNGACGRVDDAVVNGRKKYVFSEKRQKKNYTVFPKTAEKNQFFYPPFSKHIRKKSLVLQKNSGKITLCFCRSHLHHRRWVLTCCVALQVARHSNTPNLHSMPAQSCRGGLDKQSTWHIPFAYSQESMSPCRLGGGGGGEKEGALA